MPTTAQGRRSYHHGDLPSALVDAALELVAENGVQGFSVAEAARRTGVSISAPYRHFSDRDELLAAVGARGYEELLGRFQAAMAGEKKPADRVAALCAAYVRFAAERRPMFEVLFGAGLEKAKYPALEAAAHQVVDAISGVALELVPGRDEELAGRLVYALGALAQGHASMLLESGAPVSRQAVDDAAERAAAAAMALVRGRSALFAR